MPRVWPMENFCRLKAGDLGKAIRYGALKGKMVTIDTKGPLSDPGRLFNLAEIVGRTFYNKQKQEE
jgi:hypothetical protein